MTQEEIIELTNNMSIEDIIEHFKITKEGIRHYFSKLLADKENHNINTNIIIEDDSAFGLPDCQKPVVYSIFEYKDVIYFNIDNNEYELDQIDLDTQLNVLKEFI